MVNKSNYKRRKMAWMDFNALQRDDKDEKFGLFDFIFYGSREMVKYWWWVFIPLLNVVYVVVLLLAWITIPIRLAILYVQLEQLKQNAYDIEDTVSEFRLIRNMNGDLGLCQWGESYMLFSRRVLLESKYVAIKRWGDGFIVTNKDGKKGVYDTEKCKWVFPCTCASVKIESADVIIVTQNNRTQRYNLKGDRILN